MGGVTRNRDGVTLISKSFFLENMRAEAIEKLFVEALEKCKSHIHKVDDC